VASTVGAGDSFLGGMMAALAAGASIEEAFRMGVAAGSAAVLSPGTELCREEDVKRLLQEVTISELAHAAA
jgi:6-phosphofructokinase 2